MRIMYVGPQIDPNAQFDAALTHMNEGDHVIFHAHSYSTECPNPLGGQEPTTHICWDSSDLLKKE